MAAMEMRSAHRRTVYFDVHWRCQACGTEWFTRTRYRGHHDNHRVRVFECVAHPENKICKVSDLYFATSHLSLTQLFREVPRTPIDVVPGRYHVMLRTVEHFKVTGRCGAASPSTPPSNDANGTSSARDRSRSSDKRRWPLTLEVGLMGHVFDD